MDDVKESQSSERCERVIEELEVREARPAPDDQLDLKTLLESWGFGDLHKIFEGKLHFYRGSINFFTRSLFLHWLISYMTYFPIWLLSSIYFHLFLRKQHNLFHSKSYKLKLNYETESDFFLFSF